MAGLNDGLSGSSEDRENLMHGLAFVMALEKLKEVTVATAEAKTKELSPEEARKHNGLKLIGAFQTAMDELDVIKIKAMLADAPILARLSYKAYDPITYAILAAYIGHGSKNANPSMPKLIEVMEALIAGGASINGPRIQQLETKSGTESKSESDIKAVYEAKKKTEENVDQVVREWPLLYALWQNIPHVAEWLVKKGASVTAEVSGYPLAYYLYQCLKDNKASAYGAFMAAKRIGIDFNAPYGRTYKRTVLVTAACDGAINAVTALLAVGADPEWTFQNQDGVILVDTILMAMQDDKTECVCMLIEACSKDSLMRDFGAAKISMAAAAIHNKQSSVLPLLVKKCGPDILHKADTDGDTTLHHAVFGGVNLDVIQTLMELGADPTIRNKDGKTAGSLLGRGASRARLLLGEPVVDENEDE